MYDFDDDEEGGRSLGRTLTIGAAVLAVAALGWFVVRPRLGDDGGAVGSTPSSEAPETSAATEPTPVATAAEGVDEAATTVRSAAVTTASSAAVAPATTGRTTTTAETSTSTSTSTSTTTSTTLPPTTTAAPAFETLPDGSPAPVIAVFDTNSITLTGAVPDQAAKDRLHGLAVANAKPGQADFIDNQLTLNPGVPMNVGVRVVELTSTRFPDGRHDILPQHAVELDRIATIMNALPNVTALIIGHADQRGDSLSNYALSEERALAVKNYVISKGIAPTRLSSRAVGEEDLLTLENDAAALALNRRTEIVFYGLLLG